MKQARPVLVRNCIGCHGSHALRKATAFVSETKEFLKELISAVKVLLVELASLIWLALTIYSILSSKGVSASSPGAAEGQNPSKHQSSPASKRVPHHPPAIPMLTAMHNTAWAKNPIDAFILDRLRKESLPHAPLASKQTLIRRLYYDLTGLPPTPAEVAAFVADTRPDAYEKLVDKLLATPHYGERWGQHWLDVARYAESDGVASSRNKVLTETTNIIGSAFLGITLDCARCHNHKFDPLRQKDYYRIQAFFTGVRIASRLRPERTHGLVAPKRRMGSC